MGSEEVASRALDEGATNYLRKRGGTERYELLANRIQNAVEQYRTSERVEHLARIRTLVNDVNQALVRAENRDEIETATCEILSDSEPYEAAWLGDVADDRIVPREGAGVPDDALDAVSVSAESVDLGPAGDAVRDRDVTVLAVESDRSTAVPPDVDCQSMATVPLVYDTTMFGVLVVYVGETDAFDEAERSLLVELGDDIAHALDSVRTRAELERRNDLFRKAQDIADVGAWEYDVETDELRWTVEVYEIHDLPRDTDVTLEEAIDFYHPEDRTAIREVFQGAIEQGDSYDMELRLTTAGDDYRWVHTRGEPQFEDGELVRIRGTIQDITERKERERELELYRTMVETVPDAVYALDEDLHYIAVNSAMAELTGYSRSELVGSHLSLVVDEDPVETARENRRKLLESDADVLTHEYAHRTADGEEIPGREPVSPASQRRRVPRDCRGDT